MCGIHSCLPKHCLEKINAIYGTCQYKTDNMPFIFGVSSRCQIWASQEGKNPFGISERNHPSLHMESICG